MKHALLILLALTTSALGQTKTLNMDSAGHLVGGVTQAAFSGGTGPILSVTHSGTGGSGTAVIRATASNGDYTADLFQGKNASGTVFHVDTFGSIFGSGLQLTGAADFAGLTNKSTVRGDLGTNDAGNLTAGTLSDGRLSAQVVLSSGSYSNPSWITTVGWSKITGLPTSLAGYGITDPVVLTSGTYANPSWLTSVAWSKLTSTPTTLAGYGITDSVSSVGTTTYGRSLLTLADSVAAHAAIGGGKVVANGAALTAAVPDYAGQLMVALDSGVGIPRTAAAGHETDAITWQAGMHYMQGLSMYGTSGRHISSGTITVTASDATPMTITIPAGLGYVDNPVYIENDSGGYTAIAGRQDLGGAIGVSEGWATGWAPTGAPYSFSAGSGQPGRVFTEAGKGPGVAASATDVRGSMMHQYATYLGTTYFYTRSLLAENGDRTFYGLGAGLQDSFSGTINATVESFGRASDGHVGFGTTTLASGYQVTVAGKVSAANVDTTIALRLYVDKTNGSDTTGTRGKTNLPYATIGAAVAAASIGDTIVLRAASTAYNERDLWKTGGSRLHFEPGAKVVYTGSGGPIFDDHNTAGVYEVTGDVYAEHQYGTGESWVIKELNAGSTVLVEGRELRAHTDEVAVYVGDGNFECCTRKITAGAPIESYSTGSLVVKGCALASTYSGGSACVRLQSTNTTQRPSFFQCTFDSTASATAAAFATDTPSAACAVLMDCIFQAASGATYAVSSYSGTGNIKAMASYANKPAVNVTDFVGGLTVDTDVTAR